MHIRRLALVPALCFAQFAFAAEPTLPGIGAAMQEVVAKNEIAGAITLVVAKDKVLHMESTGLADVAEKRPMTPDTLFWIASMTKPITGTAVLMLQDEGKLNVADPVAKYLPEFANLKTPSGKPANLTITQILTHTSGLGEAGGPAAKDAKTLADLVPLWLAAPMQFEPGAKWSYCQSGINAAARIVEVVSGMSFDAFLQKRLFDPLGMKDTTFYPNDAQRSRLVTAYAKNKDTGALEPVPPRADFGTRDHPPQGNGGLFSTAPDYARFCQMLLAGGTLDGHRYLSADAMKFLATPQTGDLPVGFFQNDTYGQRGKNYGWGLGTCVLRTPHDGVAAMLSPGTFGHGGAWGTQAWIDPVRGVAYVLMVQRANFPNSDASDVRRSFQQAAADALAAEPPRPRLQIINGSAQTVDVFWLKSPTERVPNGSIEPGKDTIITTTLGHRFVVVGRDIKHEAAVSCLVPVQAYRFDPDAREGIPAFYTQSVSANGFPIVASAKVNPYALKEAAFLVNQMLANRPDVREAMIQSGARLCIMAWNEYTTDLPEFARMASEKEQGFEDISAKDYWDARARGMGGSETDPVCSAAEENLLGYPGDPYFEECILIHEFAHNIHLRGMVNVDPTFDTRLKSTYDAAMKAGLWKGKYAAVNHHEYFAEGVQSWFDNNRVNDHDHNHVNTRALLLEYDPGLAAMCREVFGDTVIKYTKPATRLTGHLAGYDPATAPTFAWPERLKAAKAAIHAKAVARDQAANGDGQRETRTIAGWAVRISRDLLASDAKATARALELLQAQLEEIIRVVPAPAVAELQKVTLWISPEYPNTPPRAEYHPAAGWLREHGRDPAMAKGVEFTDVRDFEAETRRMPNFTLHELAHSFHDRVLPGGFGNAEIKAAYEKAKASGKYDSVERQDSEGRKRMDRAYAMTDPQEYFAESTEAFFSRNDFFPYNREQLKQHDPAMFELLGKLWGVEAKPADPARK